MEDLDRYEIVRCTCQGKGLSGDEPIVDRNKRIHELGRKEDDGFFVREIARNLELKEDRSQGE